MPQQELLNAVISALEGAAIPYMLTGSVVSSMQGEPRATHDIDVIVSLRAEDTILAKLRWAVMSGGSEKQFGDALCFYEVQQPGLDVACLEQWVRELGVRDLWGRLLSEAEVL